MRSLEEATESLEILLPELMFMGVVVVGALLCCWMCSVVATNNGAACSARCFFFDISVAVADDEPLLSSEALAEAGAEYPVGSIVGSLA